MIIGKRCAPVGGIGDGDMDAAGGIPVAVDDSVG